MGHSMQFEKSARAGPRIQLTDGGRRLRSVARQSLAGLLASTALGGVSAHAAIDGTWTGPGNEWTDGTNWSSNPSPPDGTGTFTNNGAPAAVGVSGLVNIGVVTFTGAAPAYTITIDDFFLVNGAGVTNNSAHAQTFNVNGSLLFQNGSSASAG